MQYTEEDDIELIPNSAPLLATATATRGVAGNGSPHPAVRSKTPTSSYSVNRRLLRARNLLFLSIALNLLVTYWAFGHHTTSRANQANQANLYTALVKGFPLTANVFHPDRQEFWDAKHTEHYERLHKCLAAENCSKNTMTIVIISWHFCSHPDWTRGEDVMCQSILYALDQLGYTYFFTGAVQAYVHSFAPRTKRLLSVFGDNVKVILGGEEQAFSCTTDTNKECWLSEDVPEGIDPDIFLGLTWWGQRPWEPSNHSHPLGTEWLATPHQIPNHTWIGYSVEHTCTTHQYIPTELRNDTAIVLSKRLDYFWWRHDAAWSLDTYEKIVDRTGFSLHSFLDPIPTEEDYNAPNELERAPKGIIWEGSVTRPIYAEKMAGAKALLGIGMPGASPSPYVALCLGVPFINPHKTGGRAHTLENWYLSNNQLAMQDWQHGPLAKVGPPYVYNVPFHDVDALVAAFEDIRRNPIQRFVPDDMKMSSLIARVESIVQTDWRAKAAKRKAELEAQRIAEQRVLARKTVPQSSTQCLDT